MYDGMQAWLMFQQAQLKELENTEDNEFIAEKQCSFWEILKNIFKKDLTK